MDFLPNRYRNPSVLLAAILAQLALLAPCKTLAKPPS